MSLAAVVVWYYAADLFDNDTVVEPQDCVQSLESLHRAQSVEICSFVVAAASPYRDAQLIVHVRSVVKLGGGSRGISAPPSLI